MITRRRLNKKLELLIHRQNFLAEIIFHEYLNEKGQKKAQKIWNDMWFKIMEGKDGQRS